MVWYSMKKRVWFLTTRIFPWQWVSLYHHLAKNYMAWVTSWLWRLWETTGHVGARLKADQYQVIWCDRKPQDGNTYNEALFKIGKALLLPMAQSHYIQVNYTQVNYTQVNKSLMENNIQTNDCGPHLMLFLIKSMLEIFDI